MFKAFFKLWLVVFIPLFFLIFPNPYSPITLFNEYAEKTRFVNAYSGTFYLIEKQLEKVSSKNWQNEMAKISQNFGYDLSLNSIQTLSLSQSQLSKLNKGEFVFINAEPEALLKRLFNSDHAIKLALDLSQDEELLRASKGTFYLIKQQLNNQPQENWQSLVDNMASHFNYKLSFLTESQLKIQPEQFHQLQNGELIWTLSEKNEVTFYSQITNSQQILVAKAIPISSVSPLLIILILLMFIVVISTGMFMWVKPLWSDLNQLADTAKTFGDGDLKLRAQLSKTSVIARMGGSFNLMAKQIESLIQGQKSLTNAIAHDLRTPLYRLRFAFEMLNDENLSSSEKERYQQSVDQSINDLDHLINQTLVLSRYSRKHHAINISHSQLASKIESEVALISHENKHLNIALNISQDLKELSLMVDQTAMIRALNNLVSNASRYAKSQIKITFNNSPNKYQLIIEDDGIGIDKKYWQQIFQPFAQANNQQRDLTHGHGLGLAIVKQIIEAHKGTVTLSQSELGGAKFELIWPGISS